MKNLIILLMLSSLWASNTLVHTAQEITDIMGSLQAGDTLTLASGVWSDQYISLHANGSESQPVVLIAETPGEVILTGYSKLSMSGSYIEINGLNFSQGYTTGSPVIEFRRNSVRANHCRLTNTTIFNYNPPNNSTDYKWLSIYGRNNRVDHCYFAGKTHSGTTLVVWLQEEQDRDNHHIIEYNYFGYRPDLGYNGGETIRIGTSDYSMTNSRTRIQHNLFEQCDGEIEIISNKSCENIYFNNTFINNAGMLTLRHGERCLVEGNFFFGAGNDQAGGVRIIGADHVIINNYFQDLISTGYRSAIVFVKGVADSPLNRYFQVDNALVAFNTLLNCRQSFLMGYGTSDDQTLPPINCTIANNAVSAPGYAVFHTGDTQGLPQNFSYAQNIVIGSSLGIADTSAGIIWQDPLFSFQEEGLMRPTAESPLIGQAAELNYAVTTDMDGHVRGTVRDVGADQVSIDPILYRPMTHADVGPDWHATQTENIHVEAGQNTLVEAAQLSLPGDTLFLMGLEYGISESIMIDRDILILPDETLTGIPAIRATADVSSIFSIQGGHTLQLSGVIIDGGASQAVAAQSVFHANYDDQSKLYKLDIRDVNFQNLGMAENESTLLRVHPGSLADSLIFMRWDLSDIQGVVFSLDVSQDESGVYNVRQMKLEDCTFWNISRNVLNMYGGDSNPFSVGPVVLLDHCTFHHCGYENVPVINARQVDVATIQNSIFSQSSQSASLVELYSWSQIKYTNVYASGDITLYPNVVLGSGMLYDDPQFSNPAEGLFDLEPGSVLYDHPGTDGLAYGDRRRHDPSVPQTVDEPLINSHELVSHFPNPFNGGTTLRILLDRESQVDVQIYDLSGRVRSHPVSKSYSAGSHDVHLNLNDFESGVYLCKVILGSRMQMTKMTVIK